MSAVCCLMSMPFSFCTFGSFRPVFFMPQFSAKSLPISLSVRIHTEVCALFTVALIRVCMGVRVCVYAAQIVIFHANFPATVFIYWSSTFVYHRSSSSSVLLVHQRATAAALASCFHSYATLCDCVELRHRIREPNKLHVSHVMSVCYSL